MRMMVSAMAVLLCVALLPSAGWSKKATKKSAKAKVTRHYKSGIQFLSIKQLAHLNYNERVKYMKTFRQAFSDIEKFQRSFKPDPMAPPEKSAFNPGNTDIYALLFGPAAVAQNDTHTRGSQCADQCIYAMHLSHYKRVNGQCERYPFGCDLPQRCNYGGGTQGIQCNFLVSGIKGRGACISYQDRNRSTTACNEKRLALAANDDAYVTNLVKSVQDYFGLRLGVDGARAKINKKDLLPDDPAKRAEVLRLLKGVVDTLYSDRSYALLIGLFQLYKDAGMKLPLAELGPEYANLEIKDLDTKFSQLTTAVDDIFMDYTRMCDKPLAADVVATIRSGKNTNLRGYAGATERKRQAALREVEASGGTPTSRNVLQIPECFEVSARFNSLKETVRQVASTFPELSDDAPEGTPTVPDAPSDSQSDVTPTGCATNVVRDNALLYQGSARCLVCAMEKTVHNDDNDPTPNHDTYTTSRKWASLLATMALACGRGVDAEKLVETETMLEMFQTFGHCSSDTYDWDTSDLPVDHNKVQTWAQNNYWTMPLAKPAKKKKFLFFTIGEDDALPQPDRNEDFNRTYGISYTEATALFCDPENFDMKVDRDGYPKTIRSIKNARARGYSRNDATRGNRMASGRARLAYALNHKKKMNSGDNPVANDLAACMDESLQRARAKFRPGSNMCLATAPYASDGAVNMLEQQMKSERPPGNVLYSGSECYVGKQVERAPHLQDNNRIIESLAFVDSGVQAADVRIAGHKGTIRVDRSLMRTTATDPNRKANLTFYTQSQDRASGMASRLGQISPHDPAREAYLGVMFQSPQGCPAPNSDLRTVRDRGNQ